MGRWIHYTYLARDVGRGNRPEERIAMLDNWVNTKLETGRRVRKELPVQGELNWSDGCHYPVDGILPKNAISRNGFVNEIWVPSDTCEIRLYDYSFFGVYQDLPIGYGVTVFYIWRGSTDRDVLLL